MKKNNNNNNITETIVKVVKSANVKIKFNQKDKQENEILLNILKDKTDNLSLNCTNHFYMYKLMNDDRYLKINFLIPEDSNVSHRISCNSCKKYAAYGYINCLECEDTDYCMKCSLSSSCIKENHDICFYVVNLDQKRFSKQNIDYHHEKR